MGSEMCIRDSPQTTKIAPVAVLERAPVRALESRWGTKVSKVALKTLRHVSSCCVAHLSGTLGGMQASGKALVSSRHMHTTTLVRGHFASTRGRAEAARSRWQNRSSKADKAVIMRSHEACCFSMMRSNMPDALVAMG